MGNSIFVNLFPHFEFYHIENVTSIEIYHRDYDCTSFECLLHKRKPERQENKLTNNKYNNKLRKVKCHVKISELVINLDNYWSAIQQRGLPSHSIIEFCTILQAKKNTYFFIKKEKTIRNKNKFSVFVKYFYILLKEINLFNLYICVYCKRLLTYLPF